MNEKIKMDDIQKLQKAIEEMQNIIGGTIQMKEEFASIINKPAKELTDEDIESIKDLRKKVEQLDEIYSRHSEAYYIEKKVKSIQEKREKYSLVDVDDLEIEEEKGYFEQAKDLIEQIESISGKQSNLSTLSYKLDYKLGEKDEMQKIEQRKDEVKGDFLATQENPSCIIMIYGDEEKVVSDKERKLMENGLLLTPAYTTSFDYGPHCDMRGYEVKHYGYDKLKFIDYSEATMEQKQKIREKEKKILDIKESTDGEYDKKGKISIPIEMDTDYSGKVKPRLSVTLETTQRELANAGIDPQDYDFERMQKKSLVNSEQIARLDENMALTTTEVGRIKGLFNRIKEFFKGKGEK